MGHLLRRREESPVIGCHAASQHVRVPPRTTRLICRRRWHRSVAEDGQHPTTTPHLPPCHPCTVRQWTTQRHSCPPSTTLTRGPSTIATNLAQVGVRDSASNSDRGYSGHSGYVGQRKNRSPDETQQLHSATAADCARPQEQPLTEQVQEKKRCKGRQNDHQPSRCQDRGQRKHLANKPGEKLQGRDDGALALTV